MTCSIKIEASQPYEFRIENGLLSRLGEQLAAIIHPCRVAVISDDRVGPLYAEEAERSLRRSGFSCVHFFFPHGEGSKSIETWSRILTFLAESHLTRDDCVLALGGGVTGDLAGFAASVFLRGIPYVQMPTSLLAMVDSSIGGKTGVDLPSGKNLVGSFASPLAVFCDPDLLETLPAPCLNDGMAECLKYGVIGDPELFALLCTPGSRNDMIRIICRSVEQKARFIAADERDTGERRLLNLGHTFGHAMELCSGYTLSHGKAVAAGMVCAARLSARLGLCDPSLSVQLSDALMLHFLPTECPYPAEQLAGLMQNDKKRSGDRITMVLPLQIGRCVLRTFEMSELPEVVRSALER